MRLKINRALGISLLLAAFLGPAGLARMKEGVPTAGSLFSTGGGLYKVAAIPNQQQCTHKVGRLWFTITNYGFFGNQGDLRLLDCLTGTSTSSAEFPGGSRVEYLFQGCMWIGGVVDGDTVVSTGTDGWAVDDFELWPDLGANGEIIKRSTVKGSPYYSPNAVSDLDLIATMYDTLTSPQFVNADPIDQRPHKPLGLKIVQNSYSWSAGWGQDWIMLDYQIVNIGRRTLKNIYLGVFVDADVGHPSSGAYYQDDLSGFKVSVPNDLVPSCPDTINIAYVSDENGDPKNSNQIFTSTSPTAATGVRVVRAPGGLSNVKTSFNWWTPNGNVDLDWGPQKAPGRQNSSGGLGQPEGDKMKYTYLSNQEFDYDEVFSVINQSAAGWLPPLNPQLNAIDIANGYDTRYLVSFGSFNLSPGDTLPLTLGYIAGEGFHRDPKNFADNLPTNKDFENLEGEVFKYQAGLDFSAFAGNARWVQRVYDNETLEDTVLCGEPPQRVPRQHGDGMPDFRGPQPPPPPESLDFVTGPGEVVIRWFGKNTETALDSFSKIEDFEGYRISLSTDGQNYTTIASFDKVDWKPYIHNKAKCRWDPAPAQPLSYEEIQQIYAKKWDTTGTLQIDPERYNAPSPSGSSCLNDLGFDGPGRLPDTSKTALNIRFCATCGSKSKAIDTVFYFARQDYNLGLGAAKLYPDSTNDFQYWYQYKISGLFPSQSYYISVAPFDFGSLTPNSTIDPLEATPNASAKIVYALPTEAQRESLELKISAYPNPYRIDEDYSHYEDKNLAAGQVQSSKRLNFINLPASCIIRIYTLDGDLVQEIKHEKDPAASNAGFDQWNLLTRNTQTVAAGLYLYTVQPTGAYAKEKIHVGKIVIIQ